MSGSKIAYAAIARESVILVSCLKSAKDLEAISRTVLPQIPRYNTKTAYNLEGYEFLAIVQEGVTYLCGVLPEFGRRLAFQFLEEIRIKFVNGSLSYRALNAVEHELDRDFQQVLNDAMNRFNRGEGDNLSKLHTQVQEVTGIMKENIERVCERGDKMDTLLDKTNDLEASANIFSTTSKRVRRKMFCKNVRMWFILGAVIAVIILLIILFTTNIIPIHGSGDSTPAPPITTKGPAFSAITGNPKSI